MSASDCPVPKQLNHTLLLKQATYVKKKKKTLKPLTIHETIYFCHGYHSVSLYSSFTMLLTREQKDWCYWSYTYTPNPHTHTPNPKPYAVPMATVLTATDRWRQNLSVFERKMILLPLTRKSLTNEANCTTTKSPAPAGQGLPAGQAVLGSCGTLDVHVRTTTVRFKRPRHSTTITKALVSTRTVTSPSRSESQNGRSSLRRLQ